MGKVSYENALTAGGRPLPGYECVAELSSDVTSAYWKVRSAADGLRLWQVVDRDAAHQVLDLTNVPVLLKIRHPHLNSYEKIFDLPNTNLMVLESELQVSDWRKRLAEARAQARAGVPWRELLEYVRQAAVALDHLNAPIHELGGRKVALFHRNLVPENLMLFRQRAGLACRLANFGLAKIADDDVVRNSRGMAHFEYDPPEYFDGWTSAVSDQFSLAVNYVEMRTGKRPFGGQLLEQLETRLSDRPELATLAPPERAVVARALACDPAKRYSTCEEFAEHLTTMVKAVEQPANKPASVPVRGSSIFRAPEALKPSTPKLATPQTSNPPPAPAAASWPDRTPEAPRPMKSSAAPFEFQESRVPPQVAFAIVVLAFSVIAVLAVYFLRNGV